MRGRDGSDTSVYIILSGLSSIAGGIVRHGDHRFYKLLAGGYGPRQAGKPVDRPVPELEPDRSCLLDDGIAEERLGDEGEPLSRNISNYGRIRYHGGSRQAEFSALPFSAAAQDGAQNLRKESWVMPTEEIEEIKQALVEQLLPIRIYLFGSYAAGTYTDESDLDFYIVVADDVSDIPAETAKAYISVRQIKRHPVDIVLGKESRFNERKDRPTFEKEVYCKGVLLYDAGSEGVA